VTRYLLVAFESGPVRCNNCHYLVGHPRVECAIYGELPKNGRGEPLRGHHCLSDEEAAKEAEK
jgi:hypothetical protein